MQHYTIQNLLTSVPLENIQIEGKIGTLMQTFFTERVLSDFAQNTIYKETEDAFRRQEDEQGVIGIWQGEFWGKWIISAARVCRYLHDEELKTFIKQGAYHLLELQREDGYIGTYKNSANVLSPDPIKAREQMGWDCKWNWNIWCRKYTLWGLVECYELTKDVTILQGAVKLADQLLKELKDNQIDIITTGTFCGLPSCSIMKPILLLYGHTADKKYLDFCIDIAEKWETTQPGLIQNSLAMKPIPDWYEDTLSWSKTYETLSCFDGLLELYRITGNPKYLEATECFYELMEKDEKNLLFSVGYNDQFIHSSKEINALTEPCDVIHYIRVCYELYKLTGNVKYMDSIELIYYNSMLAAPCKDGKWAARTVRGSGAHEYAHFQAKMQHSHCCVNNIPRGLLNAAECAVMASQNECIINLYHTYNAQINVGETVVTIQTNGDYLAHSRAKLHVCFQGTPVDILLRIPAWTQNAMVTVNGISHKASSGLHRINTANTIVNVEGTSTVQLDIEVAFDNSVHICPFTKPVPQHSCTDWQYRRWGQEEHFTQSLNRTFLQQPRCLLQKGPILLCRSKLIGNTAAEMFDGVNLIDENFTCALEPCNTDSDVFLCYTAHFSNGTQIFDTKVCDYASAANMEQNDSEYFSIYF